MSNKSFILLCLFSDCEIIAVAVCLSSVSRKINTFHTRHGSVTMIIVGKWENVILTDFGFATTFSGN